MSQDSATPIKILPVNTSSPSVHGKMKTPDYPHFSLAYVAAISVLKNNIMR